MTVTVLTAAVLMVGARWLVRRRRPRPLHLTQTQVDRVIANYERELQEDRT